HKILLQLVQDNGTPLNPDVFSSVRVIATHGPGVGTPTIMIVSPKPGPTISHDLYVAVAVTNFTLVDPDGQANAPNEGHVQLFLNRVLHQEPRAYDLGFIVDMPDGNSTITARLANNDNTPLNPDVSASVTVRILSAADPIPSEQVTAVVSPLLALDGISGTASYQRYAPLMSLAVPAVIGVIGFAGILRIERGRGWTRETRAERARPAFFVAAAAATFLFGSGLALDLIYGAMED